MKKAILILMILLFNFSFSQDSEKATEIKFSDFVQEKGKTKFRDKIFYFENGSRELVPVNTSVFINDHAYELISVEKVNEMIQVANTKVNFAVKNKSTYRPTDIRIDYMNDDKKFTIQVHYTAQNDYGATKDGYSFVYFNEDASFKTIANISQF